MKLILASNSPRRKDILTDWGYNFSVLPSRFNEKGNFLSPEETAEAFAKGKAQDVFKNCKEKDVVVLGADTIVVYNGVILGKPENKEQAIKTLKTLSGNTHAVITGFAIIDSSQTVSGTVKSFVKFNQLSDELILSYVNTGLPLDKAGSYGIQDGFDLVNEYKGSLNNIIGLPIEDIKPKLDKMLNE